MVKYVALAVPKALASTDATTALACAVDSTACAVAVVDSTECAVAVVAVVDSTACVAAAALLWQASIPKNASTCSHADGSALTFLRNLTVTLNLNANGTMVFANPNLTLRSLQRRERKN